MESEGSESADRLMGKGREEYSPEYFTHILEQYKLYVGMADRISQRRQMAHAFFIAVNTALVAFLGLASPDKLEMPESLWFPAVGTAGAILSYTWYRLIRSYRDLNSGKFKVIFKIERQLPIKPYEAEWELLGSGQDPSLYRPFTRVEALIPWVFMLLYAMLTLGTLIGEWTAF